MTKSNIIKIIRQSGLKNTKHRTEILGLLEQYHQPIAAEQLYQLLTEKVVSINLSTVYRVLETLVSKKLVTKVNLSGDNRILFEYNRLIHSHYVVCMNCKKIQVIDSCPLEGYEKSVEEKTKFKIVGHKLDLYGYCSDCLKKGIDKTKE